MFFIIAAIQLAGNISIHIVVNAAEQLLAI